MFQVISQFSELAALRPELNAVYKKHGRLTFCSPAYILTAYQNFLLQEPKNKLFFIVHKVKNEVVNYIPLYIDANKTLRYIFDVHTDYCACIGADLDFKALKELVKLILENKNIKKIEFDNLLPNDLILNSFRHFLGLGTVISCYNNHSFVQSLNEGKLLDHLKSDQKSKLKRVQRKNESYTFEVFTGDKPFPLVEIKKLRSQMIVSKTRNADFFDNAFLDFSNSLYRENELEIFTKWDQTELVSASMVLKNGEFRMVWIDLYADIQFINISAYVDYIQYLERYPNLLFSFGRGSYDYKAQNFQPHLQNLYNLRYSKSKLDFLFSIFYPIKLFVKRLIKVRK